MTTFKIFCHTRVVSGILCQPELAIDDNCRIVNLPLILPLPEICAKWHKIVCIPFHYAKKVKLA